jgi:NADH-quinone oxidoreductase subunit C
MADTLEQLAEHIKGAFADAKTSLAFGELTIALDAGGIVSFVTYLRDDPECQFTTMIDICGVDYPTRVRRFDVVYHFLSIAKNRRIRVKVETDDTTPVPSIVSVHPSADWF